MKNNHSQRQPGESLSDNEGSTDLATYENSTTVNDTNSSLNKHNAVYREAEENDNNIVGTRVMIDNSIEYHTEFKRKWTAEDIAASRRADDVAAARKKETEELLLSWKTISPPVGPQNCYRSDSDLQAVDKLEFTGDSSESED